jgi:iron complex transport system substrate-binding protein
MDALHLLGFGPRTPDALRELAATLYPDVVPPEAAHVR